jgi:hypothetical protein
MTALSFKKIVSGWPVEKWCLPKLIAIEARPTSSVDKLINNGSFAAENANGEAVNTNTSTNTLNNFFNMPLPLKFQQVTCSIHGLKP